MSEANGVIVKTCWRSTRPTTFFATSYSAGLQRTTNATVATGWATVVPALGADQLRSLALDPSLPGQLFVAAHAKNGGTVYRVSGLGVGGHPVATPLPGAGIGVPSRVEELAAVGGRLYAAAADGIWECSDFDCPGDRQLEPAGQRSRHRNRLVQHHRAQRHRDLRHH